MPFVLSYGPSHLPLPAADRSAGRARATARRSGATGPTHTKTDGPYSEAIERSLITLKALTYAPSGGIVAAPTTSLPEQVGGERNWDYRFCWIRDSTLTLLALMNAGVYDEATAWRDWLQRAVAGNPADMQIMYGLMGERRLTEWEVDWLPGYARLQAGAHRQRRPRPVPARRLRRADGHVRAGAQGRRWPRPSSGWELQLELVEARRTVVGRVPTTASGRRAGRRSHFTYSKVMAWVVLRSRHQGGRDAMASTGPVETWRKIARQRSTPRSASEGFDAERNTFRAAYGETTLDASLLLLAQVGFIEPDDPRYHRYGRGHRDASCWSTASSCATTPHETDDGLRRGEGAFLACSFWLADAYISIGRHDDAIALFDRLLAIRNDLGLLAEEYDTQEPPSDRQLPAGLQPCRR